MIRFFRVRAPFFALLLLVALLVTLPGIRHPLPMLGLVIFTALAWRALSRWRARPADHASLDDEVTRAANTWDARHGPPDELEADSEAESWRASLGPADGWRADSQADDDET